MAHRLAEMKGEGGPGVRSLRDAGPGTGRGTLGVYRDRRASALDCVAQRAGCSQIAHQTLRAAGAEPGQDPPSLAHLSLWAPPRPAVGDSGSTGIRFI